MLWKKVFIELSDFCGLKCDFCPNSKKENKHSQLGLENFNLLLQKISPKTRLIALHVLGDPLSLNNFSSYLKITQSYPKVKLEITTSGFYFSAKNLQTLSENPQIFQINVSLMSVLAQSQLSLHTYLQNIYTLVQNREKWSYKPFINLRLWNATKKRDTLLLPPQNAPIYHSLSKFFNLPLPFSTHCLESLSHFRLAPKIILHHAPLFAWPTLATQNRELQGSCYGLRSQIAILNNGEVVPCCFDTQGVLSLGNLLKEDLNSILQSKKARDIKDGFINNKLVEELCQKCSFRKLHFSH